MMRYLTRITAIASAVVGIAASASAQGGAVGTSRDSVAACHNAARIVSSGHPAHKETAALARLTSCGTIGADAVAASLDSTKAEKSVTVLTAFYWEVSRWRDAKVMAAAVRVASDAGAAVPARVFAIRHLLWLVHPGTEYTYESLIAGTASTDEPGITNLRIACSTGLSSSHANAYGTPLATDYATTVDAVLAGIEQAPPASRPVRNAAACRRI